MKHQGISLCLKEGCSQNDSKIYSHMCPDTDKLISINGNDIAILI